MKRKCSFTLFLILLGVVVFSQPSKVPVKTVTTGVKPMKMTRVALGPLSYEYKSDNGHVDDDYVTQHRMKKTLRQMLTEGSTTPVFEFRRKNSVLLVYFEILPI